MTRHPNPADTAPTADVVPIPTRVTDPVAGLPGQPQRRLSTTPQHLAQALIRAYHGHTHRLLADLADRLGVSLAYVDRPTVEAHLERALSDSEWATVNNQFTAMDLDDYLGDQGGLRTEWIEDVLDKASVPGRGYTAEGEVAP